MAVAAMFAPVLPQLPAIPFELGAVPFDLLAIPVDLLFIACDFLRAGAVLQVPVELPPIAVKFVDVAVEHVAIVPFFQTVPAKLLTVLSELPAILANFIVLRKRGPGKHE
jgi:hypothetical protein